MLTEGAKPVPVANMITWHSGGTESNVNMPVILRPNHKRSPGFKRARRVPVRPGAYPVAVEFIVPYQSVSPADRRHWLRLNDQFVAGATDAIQL